MHISWLTSSESVSFRAPCEWGHVIVMDYAQFPGDTSGRSSAVVMDVSGQSIENGMVALKQIQSAIPVWIYDPSATIASSVQWIKAGAVDVAVTLGEIGEYIEKMRRVPAEGCSRRSSLL